MNPEMQHRAQVIGRPADPQRQRLLEHLVVPGRLVIGVQQHVRVGVDQPRQQRRAGQVDRAGARRATLTSPAGPTASILSPRTRTAQPSCGFERDAVEDAGGLQQKGRLSPSVGHNRHRNDESDDQLLHGLSGPAKGLEKFDRIPASRLRILVRKGLTEFSLLAH